MTMSLVWKSCLCVSRVLPQVAQAHYASREQHYPT